MAHSKLIAPKHDADEPRHVQPDVHAARRGDDLPVPHSGHPGASGQLRAADHAGGQGRGLPAAEPAEPLSLVERGHFLRSSRLSTGSLDTGWTFYTPYSTATRTAVVPALLGRVHPRLQLDFHRAELHRHDPQAAAAGHDLVPHAAVPLGDSTPRASSRSWPRPCWASRCCCWSSSASLGVGIFDPKLRRRSRALPALLLVLLPPGRLHHDPAGAWASSAN